MLRQASATLSCDRTGADARVQVMLCSACSGHGFKMASGIGQLIAKEAAKWPTGDEEAAAELQLHRWSHKRQGHTEVLRELEVSDV